MLSNRNNFKQKNIHVKANLPVTPPISSKVALACTSGASPVSVTPDPVLPGFSDSVTNTMTVVVSS